MRWIGLLLTTMLTMALPVALLPALPIQSPAIRASRRLALRWVNPPAVEGTAIAGSVEIANHGRDTLDLTFIVVAVDEHGKAFALGYQRFPLEAAPVTIPFTSTLPLGRYYVHADAVGEYAPSQAIYRSMLQTDPDLVVSVQAAQGSRTTLTQASALSRNMR